MKQPGLAKEQFFKSFQRIPWNQSKASTLGNDWPLFNYYLSQKKISYFDYILTQRLLKPFPAVSEEAAFFICHLIMSAKDGHLCLKISNNTVFPSVNHLWKSETGQPLSDKEAEELSAYIQKGSHSVPRELISQVESVQPNLEMAIGTGFNCWPQTPVCHFNQCFYLQRHWIYESLFLNYLDRHLQTTPSLQIDLDQINSELQFMHLNGEINGEQLQAILQALTHSLSLITGGPGTGKTYTAGKLIRIFWENLLPADRLTCQIALAAPTGKAAANLQRSLSNAVSDLKDFPLLQAKTLHALLNLNQSNTPTYLNADLILIDESSMIDIKVMSHLFKSLKEGARLILLGDPYQLPSVEAGNAFIDLNRLSGVNPNISSTHLLTCLRTELTSIVDFAQQVKNGEAEEAMIILNQSNTGIKRLHFNEDPKKAQKELIAYIANFFPCHFNLETTIGSGFNDIKKIKSLFQAFNSIRLLSPMRKGFFGVDVLNQLIWQSLSQNSLNPDPIALNSQWLAVPILITTNDYRQDLFNGETGLLVRKLPLKKFSPEDFAIFADRNQEGSMRKIASILLPKYDLAYCLSVHKSQGSEFERVVLALPEGAESFGREVFYTAITRARQQIEIYGSDSTISKTILQQEIRLSGILERKSWHSYHSCAKI